MMGYVYVLYVAGYFVDDRTFTPYPHLSSSEFDSWTMKGGAAEMNTYNRAENVKLVFPRGS